MKMRVGFDVKFNAAKGAFFDREKVLKRIGAARKRILSKAGAYVMTAARQSIKTVKGVSSPGSPPNAHTTFVSKKPNKNGVISAKEKSLFKTTILFFSETHDVIIGAVLLNSVTDPPVPQLLEKGGDTTRSDSNGKVRRMFYRPRPYMKPALEKEAPKFPELWGGALNNGG